MSHTRPLNELRAGDAETYGAKSAVLGELIGAGIPVPLGFAVSTSAYASFVDEAGLGPTIASGSGIAEAMQTAPIPAAVLEEIERRYRALGDDVPVAVRSSALGEDSEEATFAGQQETYLWVRGAERVCEAVRDCWASLYSAPAIAYRARLGTTDAAMGVAVQVMVDAAVSGVLFTCNPVSGDPSMVAVNASWGLGLAVVGGEVTPDDYLVSKVTREVVREQVHAKEIEYVPGEHGAVSVAVPAERRAVACLDAAALESLVDTARLIERYFGSHQDVEWSIDRDGELHVLKSRPVTAIQKVGPPAATSAMALVMGTFGAGKKD